MTIKDFIKLSYAVAIIVINEDENLIDSVTVNKKNEIRIGKVLLDKLDYPIIKISASPNIPRTIYLTIKEG